MLQPPVKEADGLVAQLPSPRRRAGLSSYSLATQPRISFSEHSYLPETPRPPGLAGGRRGFLNSSGNCPVPSTYGVS